MSRQSIDQIRKNTTQMFVLGDAVISPLGFSSKENYLAIREGISAVRLYKQAFGLKQNFYLSLLKRAQIKEIFLQLKHHRHGHGTHFTFFEQISILAAEKAIEEAGIDPAAHDTLFIISTTKGNVELLDNPNRFDRSKLYLWSSAQTIGSFFRNPNTPIVVSNACISGMTAQQAAFFYLKNYPYQNVVVIGAESLSRFIIAGFESLKALSPQVCKPFDKNRDGLNLGEAAACIVYSLNNSDKKPKATYLSGATCNDANHISAPSREANGLYEAIEIACKNVDRQRLGFVSAHGTATAYNDAMEAVALTRAGLNHLPINSLKPYLGHTLGAAGVLENIIAYHALNDHTIIRNPTFGQKDENFDVQPNYCVLTSTKPMFLKTMSGFGGCNAAIVMARPSYYFSK